MAAEGVDEAGAREEQVLTQFLALEAILENAVGGTVTLDVERGCAPLSLALTVHDLHAATPDRFLELSGGVPHALSYHQARNFRFPCGLVYVAEPGYMLSRTGVPRFAIIQKLADRDVPDLEAFIREEEGGLKKGGGNVEEQQRREKSAGGEEEGEGEGSKKLKAEEATAVADGDEPAAAAAAAAAAADGSEASAKPAGTSSLVESALEPAFVMMEVGDASAVMGCASLPLSFPLPTFSLFIPPILISPSYILIPPTQVHVSSSVMVDGVHAQHFFGSALVVHHTPHLGWASFEAPH
ncbi:unnamed protein product [Closterium sp. Naga37s-1]|nr:unnamed protein product [Closterium sp. Naga37s-1]